MGYDASGIYQLWNGHRVIRSKDVIFDERPIQLSNAISLLPSNAIIPQTKSLEPSGSRDPISMQILDEALENDWGDGFDHSHMPINPSHANSNFSLTSLASTPDPTLSPDQSLTPVSSATSLWNTQHRVPTKLPPGFEHTAWLTIAYLAGYDAGIPDFYLILKPLVDVLLLSGSSDVMMNSTLWKRITHGSLYHDPRRKLY